MRFPAILETMSDTSFRATLVSPYAITAEGASEAEAIANLQREAIRQHALTRRVVYVDLPGVEHPLQKYAGDWKDNPMFDAYLEGIAEYRKERDLLGEQLFDDAEVRD